MISFVRLINETSSNIPFWRIPQEMNQSNGAERWHTVGTGRGLFGWS